MLHLHFFVFKNNSKKLLTKLKKCFIILYDIKRYAKKGEKGKTILNAEKKYKKDNNVIIVTFNGY